MNRWRWLFVILAAALCAGVFAANRAVVRPEHVVNVVCEEEPSLSKDYTVTREGFIVMQFVGAVSIAGLREDQAAAKIAATLIEQRILPRATVELKILGNSETGLISFAGAVASPGQLFPRKGLRLSDVVAEAKPTPAADLDRVKILPANGQEISVNYSAFLSGKDIAFNPEIRAGDRVFFELAVQSIDISITGMVQRPGVVRYEPNFTLARAIEAAGGLNPNADPNAVRVERNGSPLAAVTPAMQLLAGDRIFVPQLTNQGTVTVRGSVSNPGTLGFRTGLTLGQALAAVGGLNRNANAEKVKLIRNVDGKPRTSEHNVLAIHRGMSGDVALRSGDTVEVPGSRRGNQRTILQIAGLVVGGFLFGILR